MSKRAIERASIASVSLQGRITGAAMVTAVVVLMAACAVFVFEQWRAEVRQQAAQQMTLLQAVAEAPAARAAVRDPPQAKRLLTRMAALLPGEERITLTDVQGRMVFAVGAVSSSTHPVTSVSAIMDPQGVRWGTVSASAAPAPIRAILPRYLALTGFLFFTAMGVALFLGRFLAGRVSRPVNRLAEVMGEVAQSGDYSQRVQHAMDDEIGRLTDAFNGLLANLDIKDKALRQTLTELVEARDAAQAANNLKSQFLANMSHEIRTPLNGLLAMTQVMALEDLGLVQQERLAVIRQSGEALLAVLNDVLDVSKIEAGKLELEISQVDVVALADGARAAFADTAEEKGLSLTLDIDDSARDQRLGDYTRLRQVLCNLIANGVKFTKQGRVAVTVTGDGPGGADGLVFSVSDTGIGIPQSALPSLFDTFTQADASTTRKFGGTGLGLAICRELTALMGGEIQVTSTEGQGSTFTVRVPLPRIAAPAPAPVDPPEASSPAEERAIRVLAAEDNATNQLVLKTILDIFGVETTIVENGRLAVEAWDTGDFDMILMDIQMPEMDGVNATRAIRAAEARLGRPRIPIIALSANAMTHQVKEYLEAGMDQHVPKPIELPRLQAALEEAMDRAEAARAAA